jgi:hypothetical protein
VGYSVSKQSFCTVDLRHLHFLNSCDVSGLTSSMQRLQYSIGRMEPSRSFRSLRSQAVFILQSLFDWRWEWERLYSASASEVPVVASNCMVTDVNGKPQWPTVIQYSDHHRTIEIIYYNATLVLVLRMGKKHGWAVLSEGKDREPPLGFVRPSTASPLLRPSDISSLEDACSEFYRSMEYYFSVVEKNPGTQYQLMFTLSLVSFGLEEGSKEAAWIMNMKERIIERSTFDFWSASRRSRLGL